MNRLVLVVVANCLFAIQWCIAEAETDEQVAARSDVIDFAGAFQNDGFKIRDGTYFGKVSKDHSAIVAVNLYNGNAYWFTASTAAKAKKLKISVFDEAGMPVSYEPFQSGTRAAAGFSPEASGLYYVKVALEDGPPATFCLIYSYK
jgi:hypothetical protein